ncbi:hypothetical protein scyTo_0021497, partial [Scyliorhinus torazame]|nr:hypothetical protein [Scyliorhinus torazame]
MTMRTVPRSYSIAPSIMLNDGPRVDIDPALRLARNQEKEDIKGLNNKFSDVISR